MFSTPLGCKEPYEQTLLLPTPSAINDYSHHIGGVDIANQLRAGLSTQQHEVNP